MTVKSLKEARKEQILKSAEKVFYVPNQSRNKIIGFTYKNNDLTLFEEIYQGVDFSETLSSQYNFSNPIEEEINCIIVR